MSNLLKYLWILFIVCIPGALAATRTGMHGTVSDIEGAAIPNARVLVHWDASGAGVGLKSNVGVSNDVILQRDSQGKFQTDLPPGFYDVFVSAMAFSPKCQKIRIRPGDLVAFNTRRNTRNRIPSL